MAYIDKIKERARQDKKTIVLPETTDKRTLIAASHIIEEDIADVIMVGNEEKIMDALLDSLKILVPGVCIELTTGEKGLVIQENPKDLLRPTVLTFPTNQVYVLADTDEIQIKDVMKTMDNRVIIDKERLNEYLN
jgi:hypothetical protein